MYKMCDIKNKLIKQSFIFDILLKKTYFYSKKNVNVIDTDETEINNRISDEYSTYISNVLHNYHAKINYKYKNTSIHLCARDCDPDDFYLKYSFDVSCDENDDEDGNKNCDAVCDENGDVVCDENDDEDGNENDDEDGNENDDEDGNENDDEDGNENYDAGWDVTGDEDYCPVYLLLRDYFEQRDYFRWGDNYEKVQTCPKYIINDTDYNDYDPVRYTHIVDLIKFTCDNNDTISLLEQNDLDQHNAALLIELYDNLIIDNLYQ